MHKFMQYIQLYGIQIISSIEIKYMRANTIFKNKTYNPISSDSHPSATVNKALNTNTQYLHLPSSFPIKCVGGPSVLMRA